ncbi:MAG: hypothetical protein J6R85_00560 [Lentisphaeria bacterium]|nr:hypothetical protein [Lentisphaeria bacterium]
MVKRLIFSKWAWLAAAVLLGIGGWIFWRQTPEAKIIAKVQLLAESASRPAGQKTSLELWNLHRFRSLFAPQVQIQFRFHDLEGSHTPEELGSLLMRFWKVTDFARFEASDIAVDFPEKDRACAGFTGILKAKHRGKHVDEIRELQCHFQRMDDQWMITEIHVRNILEK